MPTVDDLLHLKHWEKQRRLFDFVRPVHGLVKTDPVTVAIVDWGVQRSHRDLKDIEVQGARVIPPGDDFSDDSRHGHGTMLAGIVAAVAPGVNFLAVKFIDARTPATARNAAKAIEFALAQKKGPMVINASWDVSLDDQSLRAALEKAKVAGVLVVAGAGNGGRNNDVTKSCPATYVDEFDNLISVMASDENGRKPGFSNYGRESVHMAAPGRRIFSISTYLVEPTRAAPGSPGPGYRLYDGTSVSAAFVSASAAVLLSRRINLAPLAIRQLLIDTADRGDGGLQGLCQANAQLNLSAAVEAVAQLPSGV
jgi:serine protease